MCGKICCGENEGIVCHNCLPSTTIPGYPELYNVTDRRNNHSFLCGELAPIPGHLLFSIDHVVKITAYILLFLVSCVGNLMLCGVLVANQLKRSDRVQRLLLHMNLADLIVTLYHMPREILHASTIRWLGPDWLCRACKFFDVFGVYLGSNVLITITVDRFCCIMFPHSYLGGADAKVNTALFLSWIIAAVLSLPQIELFYVTRHPCYLKYQQCISVAFTGQLPAYFDIANTVVTAVEVYLFPFLVICVCYGIMFWKFATEKNSLDEIYDFDEGSQLSLDRRRSTAASISVRQQGRNFHMTAAMVIVFLICWTPYFIAATLHFADTDLSTGRKLGNIRIPPIVSTFLGVFATLNSCANPYLYGYFSVKLRKDVRRVMEKVISTGTADEKAAKVGRLRLTETRLSAGQTQLHFQSNFDSAFQYGTNFERPDTNGDAAPILV